MNMDIKSTVMYKTLFFYVCILLFMLFSVRVMAGEVNQDVADDTQGVVQLKVVYTDDDQDNHDVQAGTGFLINNNTVITCDHVITVDETTLRQAARNFGKNVSDIKNRLSIEVSVMRDVSIKATVINESAEMDFSSGLYYSNVSSMGGGPGGMGEDQRGLGGGPGER